MKIAIRADGGSQIGMGHIMRTLVLAKELKKENEVIFVCKDNEDNKKGTEKVVNEGFQVKLVREKSLIQDLSKIRADLLITDSYDVDEEYFNKTKALFRKTAYIDDMNIHYFNVDLLINQNIGAENLDYRTNGNTTLLLGSKYVMLRDEFRNLHNKTINKKVKEIMVTVGGADPFMVTERILEWATATEFNFHATIGPSFTNSEDLKKLRGQRIQLYENANMYKLMMKCDIAISACGSTLYELATCGVPTIGIILADNQLRIAEKLDEEKIIINLGWHDKIEKESFLEEVNNMASNYNARRDMSIRASNLVDGKGVHRIGSAINNLKFH